MERDPNVVDFRFDPGEVSVRRFFNDRFPEIDFDPLEVFSKVDEGAIHSVGSLLDDAEIHPTTLSRVVANLEEMPSHLALMPQHNTIGLLTEYGTGASVGVVSSRFLGNVIDQLSLIDSRCNSEQLFQFASRMCLIHINGLASFEQMNPWNVLEAKHSNTVDKQLAISLLCTGSETGLDMPKNLLPHYMHKVLSQRFAATMMYADCERLLVKHAKLLPEEARGLVDSFIESRITALVSAQRHGSLAVPEVDEAFARPLPSEEFRSFTKFASLLWESVLAPHELTIETEPQ